jgi:hypothetical protein
MRRHYDELSRRSETRPEAHLASDKGDAHLRQFQLETPRGVIDSVVERTLRSAIRAPLTASKKDRLLRHMHC